MGALSPPGGSRSLWACRMLGVSEDTTTWGCCVDAKPRTAVSLRRVAVFLVDRRAETSVRLLGILMAMIEDLILISQLQ